MSQRISSSTLRISIYSRRSGFTLFELLISMSILVFLVVLVAQILSSTNVAVQAASKQLDIAAQARTALDRLGSNFSGCIVTQGAAPVVMKNGTTSAAGLKNDGLAFITNARPRDRTTGNVVLQTPANFIRMAVMGYGVWHVKDNALNNTDVPMMYWGDGTVSWSTKLGAVQDAKQAKSDLKDVMKTAAGDLLNPIPELMVNYEFIGQGVFRFEVCFLLDDGTIAPIPPRDINYPSITGNTYAVALSKASSADVNKRFVRAFIAGIAGLDTQTRQLVGVNGSGLSVLADVLPDPGVFAGTSTIDPAKLNQTPLQAWDFTSGTTDAGTLRTALLKYPRPVINALRTYQRYYYVSDTQ